MNNITKKHDKKTWVTPEIKTITQFDVHENVVATSVIDLGTIPGTENQPVGG